MTNQCRYAAAAIAAAFSFSLAAATPKYVFLFIGDGMGLGERMLAEEFSLATGGERLAMNHLPFSAVTRTVSSDSPITDSAAAATAIACGEKTRTYALGVDPATNRLVSCAEAARDRGYRVGISTTVYLSHATPAGFYAHRPHRGMTDAISWDLGRSGFDFFAGGGLHMNYRQFAKKCEAAYNYIHTNGYQIVSNRTDFLALKPGCGKVFTRFFDHELTSVIDATSETLAHEPTLEEIVAKGIELLDNDRGFFFMCEGGSIDWTGHGNDAAANIREVLMLDRCVRRALEFLERHPDETLIVVTGDHETGGLSLGYTSAGYNLHLPLLAAQKLSAEAFRQKLSDRFKADPTLSEEDIKAFVTESFGLKFEGDAKQDRLVLTESERDEILGALRHDVEFFRAKVTENDKYDGEKSYLLGAACRTVLSHKSGLGWSSRHHTAMPVITTAVGVGAERFSGFIENSDIGIALKGIFQN